MKKIFFTFVTLLTISAFAQNLFVNKDKVYGMSEFGDLIVYYDGSTSKVDANGGLNGLADCCCYQGYDADSNALSKLYGSCCWMDLTPGKPRCAFGCV